MSDHPQGQPGTGDGVVNPALRNANAALANFNFNSASANPIGSLGMAAPPTQASNASFTPGQLSSLTEFHRQNAGLANAPSSANAPTALPAQATPPRPSGLSFFAIMPEPLRLALQNRDITHEQRQTLVASWSQSEQGKAAITQLQRQQQQQIAQMHANGSVRPSAQAHPSQTPTAPASQGVTSEGQRVLGSPHRPPNSFGPMSSPEKGQRQIDTPATIPQAGPSRSPTKPSGSLPTSIGEKRPSQSDIPVSQPSNSSVFSRPAHQPGRNDQAEPSSASSRPAPPDLAHVSVEWLRSRASAANEPPPRPAPSRRREEGMRGTMRAEISRLMYAAGDVENPDLDTIDYMEDLVVDWLADLCTPPPAVRPVPSGPLIAPRLDHNVIRHRLSRPSMRKYLDRFEYMEYKAIDMRSARRVARGNFEPLDQKDLDRQLEKGFLDAEDASGGVAAQRKGKRKYTRHAERAGPSGPAGGGEGEVKERKKPGPKKGWKAGLGEDKGQGRKYKRARQYASQSASSGRGPSVKPEETTA